MKISSYLLDGDIKMFLQGVLFEFADWHLQEAAENVVLKIQITCKLTP